MGNFCFSTNNNAKLLKENGKRLDEQLRTVQREDKPPENDSIALIVYNETLQYCQKMINFLFEVSFILENVTFLYFIAN